MPLVADSNGAINGTFTIPAGIPAGTKTVEFQGSGGSKGSAVFVGESSTQINNQELVTDVTVDAWDPLAQTFMLDNARQLVGIKLWFTVKPTSVVEVQIRDVVAGFPGSTILASSKKAGADTVLGGLATTFLFDTPMVINANSDYAIVVICNDADGEISVAELGKWDTVGAQWVTTQPYTVGVLLMSSNAKTWTADQTRDMTFELLVANYTETTRTVALGIVAVTDATDLVLLSGALIPTSDCRVDYRLTFPDASVKVVSTDQPVQLLAPITGNIQIDAILTGTSQFSPVLLPGTQLLSGTIGATGTYITRAIPAGAGVTVKVALEAYLPSGATLAIEYKGIDGGDVWAAVPFVSSSPLDNGWVEMNYAVTPVTEDMVRVRITLNGTPAARPQVANLRTVIL